MSKNLAASNKVMKSYLSELMTDEDIAEDNTKLEKLLSTVDESQNEITTHKSQQKPEISTKVIQEEVITEEIPEVIDEVLPENVVESDELISTAKSESVTKTQPNFSKDSFQAMFFKVAGLVVAVPLVELGGIHNLTEIHHLMGKPDWFKGVMLNREDKINVVDTALWVMPERCTDELIESLNYDYIIMLSDSHWGLAAESIVDTITLSENDVKWVESPDRPWLAGLVKDRMCALLNVESLINLLNKG